MKKIFLSAVMLLTAFLPLKAAYRYTSDIADWLPIKRLADGRAEAVTVDNVKAFRLTTTGGKAKYFLQNQPLIKTRPGSKYRLTFKAKSNIASRSGARAGVSFFTANGDRAGGKRYTVMTQCGNNKEWKDYKLDFTIPSDGASFAVVCCIYQAAGTAEFTAFKLFDAQGNEIKLPNGDCSKAPVKVVAPGKAKKKAVKKPVKKEYIPEDAVWSYRFNADGRENSIHITGLTLDAELVDYTGKGNIKLLKGRGTARSEHAMKYNLGSPMGSSHWRFCNITTLEQVMVFSNEAIPLTGGFKTTKFAIPFTGHFADWQSSFAKGSYAIRGHHYFQVRDGKTLVTMASTKKVDAQISPEAGFFGNSRTGNKQPLQDGLFTLANLKNFKLEISDFRSSGKANGEFAFQLILTDADNDKFIVNRADKITVTADGETLECAPQFDRYMVPTGYFAGKFGKTLPGKLNIKLDLRAALRNGVKNVSVEKSFPAAKTGLTVFQPDKKEFVIKKNEARAVCFHPQYLPKDEAAGKAMIRDIINKMKKANLNEFFSFAILNRCNTHVKIGSKYMLDKHKWDVFAALREETRKANIKFGALVCLLPEGAEKPKGFLAEHPEYAMRNIKGERLGWMDPAVPEVREYRIKDISAILKKYDVDALDLDYTRMAAYPSDRGAELYMKEFGKDPRKFEHSSPDYIHWYTWNSKHLTQWIRDIRSMMKKDFPQVKLSAYVQGYRHGENALWRELHQPFADWLKEGLLDRINPTGYVYDMLMYRCWVKRQVDYCRKHNANIPIVITIGVKSSHGAVLDLKELVDQIDVANELGCEGSYFFQWFGLEPFIDGLSKTRYAEPADK